MTETKKLLALVIPASGHINVMCCIVRELLNRNTTPLSITMFSTEKYKELVERSGAEYKEFQNSRSRTTDLEENVDVFDIMEILMDASKRVLPELIQYCEQEKPDLILCDAGRFLLIY
jgi:UDP:flavonoid glycosyltransferase YjiC (YdhE family)